MIGKIEQIELGHEDIKLFGKVIFKKSQDQLDISNGKGESIGWLQFLNLRYRQLGTFKVDRPHDFKEGDNVECTFGTTGKIVSLKKVV